MTQTLQPTKLKLFTLWLLTENVCQALLWSHSIAINSIFLVTLFCEIISFVISASPSLVECEFHESRDVVSILLMAVTPENLEVFNECVLFD